MSEATASSFGEEVVRDGPSWLMDFVAATLFLTIGIGIVLEPYTTGRDMPGAVGGLVDGRFNLSVLEFFYRVLLEALHGQRANFLDAPFFYPWPRSINFSDTLWGSAPVYALLRAAGLSAFASFQAWFVIGFVLTYIAAFVSLRKFELGAWGAAMGAFLFTFCLPMTDQFSHAQLVYRLWDTSCNRRVRPFCYASKPASRRSSVLNL